MKTLKKVYDIFSKIEKYILFAVFFFATVMVVINVFGRKLFGFSFNWLEELNRYILIFSAFIGGSIAVTSDMHPRMDSVLQLLKGKARLTIEAVGGLLMTVFLGVMTYYALLQLQQMIRVSAMTATLVLPVYVFFAFIPIGFFGMTVRSAIKLVFLFGSPTPEKGAEE